MFQYITMAILFSKGKPYRQPLYTNKKFTGVLLLTTLICCYITLIPPSWVVGVLDFNLPPEFDARIQLLMIAGVNLVLAFLVEEILVDVILQKMIYPRFKQYRKSLKSDVRFEEVDVKTIKQTVIKSVKEYKNGQNGNMTEDKYIVTKC